MSLSVTLSVSPFSFFYSLVTPTTSICLSALLPACVSVSPSVSLTPSCPSPLSLPFSLPPSLMSPNPATKSQTEPVFPSRMFDTVLSYLLPPGEYSSYCPGTRYRTCRDCYNHIPNCRGIRDGIHTIPPGRRVSKAFVYCLDQRALVYSQCPNGFIYYDAAKTCVMRTSGMLPPYILATVTEPPEV